jgi:phosphorylase/glycogen(starch) synthase
MMEDYCIQYYQPQYDRFNFLMADGCAKAREIAAWKKRVEEAWPNIKVISQSAPNASYVLSQDNPLASEVVVDLAGLSPEDIGVELIFAVADKKNVLHIQEKIEYNVDSFENGVASYRTSVIPERTGMYQIGIRLYAKNALLPHRMDFPLVKWL